jgi:hypothetical protein
MRCRCFAAGCGILPRMILIRFAALACCIALAPSLASAKEYRSLEVKREFQRQHPCPSTGGTTGACPGYIKRCPARLRWPDPVSNQQWQTTAPAWR